MAKSTVIPVGHRGASAYAPENTIAAFEEAIRLGAKAVEFDVHMTADGQIVVIHDETLDRTTTGAGRVAEKTRFDLLTLDAGSWMHPRFAGQRIPSLDEALLAIGPHAMPVIELKAPVPAELLLKSLRRFDLEGEAVVLSFEEEWLRGVRMASGEVAVGLLSDEWRPELPERAKALGAELLVLNVDILGTTQIGMAEHLGLEVWCFTANDVGMVAACAAMGVTGIITDRPDLIRTR